MKHTVIPLAVCSIFALHPVYAEQETFEAAITDAVPGSVYTLFKDAEGKIPCIDNEGNNVEAVIDENGTKEMIFQEKGYLIQTEVPNGYYRDADVYPLQKEINAHADKIEYSFVIEKQDNTEDDALVILDESGHEKGIANEEVCSILHEGHTYFLHHTAEHEWIDAHDIRFTVPHEKPAGQMQVTCVEKNFGKFQIDFQDGSGSSIEDLHYGLFKDETCQTIAKDVKGIEAVKENNTSLCMEEGTYYLKVVDAPEQYLTDDFVQSVEVVQGEMKTETFALPETEKQISVYDAVTHEPLPFRIKISDGVQEQIVQNGDFVKVRRNQMYQISDVEAHDGYYGFTSFETPLTDCDKVEIAYQPVCFKIRTINCDTGKEIEGLQYALNSDDEEHVIDGSSQHLAFVQAGIPYSLQILNLPQYLYETDTISFVPNETGMIEKTLYARPYTSLQLNETNLMDAKLSIYLDEACTKPAKDIKGNVVENFEPQMNVNLFHGNYYVKLTIEDPHYYENQMIQKVSCFSNASSVSFVPESLDAELQFVDDKNNPVSNIIIDFLNPENQVVKSYQGNGLFHLSDVFSKEEMEKGEQLQYRIKRADGQFAYSKELRNLVLSENKEEQENPVVILSPYEIVELKNPEAGLESVYRLYLDEKCTMPARNVDGSYAEFHVNDETNAYAALRRGTYYLKEESPHRYSYKNEAARKIEIEPDQQAEIQLETETSPIRISVFEVDEKGSAVYGGKYALYDENNKLLYEWNLPEVMISSPILERGKAYRIHEEKAPEGYVGMVEDIRYTVGEEEPASIPEIKMIHQEEKQVRSVQKAQEKKQDYRVFAYAGACILFAFSFMLIKKHRLK